LLREWCKSEDKLCSAMGKRMLVKYYKYWGDREKERGSDAQLGDVFLRGN
jgi:hypothetical protein